MTLLYTLPHHAVNREFAKKVQPVILVILDTPVKSTMKIREFQEYLKDRLNEVEALVNGNCNVVAGSIATECRRIIRNGH